MLLIFLSIVAQWLTLGAGIYLVMILCLKFANLCEYVVDFFVTKK
jgi:hypothetical protein